MKNKGETYLKCLILKCPLTQIQNCTHTHATYFHILLLLRVSMLSWRTNRDDYEVPPLALSHYFTESNHLSNCFSLNAWNVKGTVVWSPYDCLCGIHIRFKKKKKTISSHAYMRAQTQLCQSHAHTLSVTHLHRFKTTLHAL